MDEYFELKLDIVEAVRKWRCVDTPMTPDERFDAKLEKDKAIAATYNK
jgi:hypothetical protein